MLCFFIEGLDNVGKTTLIKRLADIYLECGYIPVIMHSDSKQDYFKLVQRIKDIFTEEYSSGAKYVIFLDRSWIDEFVYGQIYRGRNELDVRKQICDIVDSLKTPPIVFNSYLGEGFTEDDIRAMWIDYIRDHFYEIYLQASTDFVLAHEDNKSLSVTCTVSDSDRRKKIMNERVLFTKAMDINALFLDDSHRRTTTVQAGTSTKFKDKKYVIRDLGLPIVPACEADYIGNFLDNKGWII